MYKEQAEEVTRKTEEFADWFSGYSMIMQDFCPDARPEIDKLLETIMRLESKLKRALIQSVQFKPAYFDASFETLIGVELAKPIQGSSASYLRDVFGFLAQQGIEKIKLGRARYSSNEEAPRTLEFYKDGQLCQPKFLTDHMLDEEGCPIPSDCYTSDSEFLESLINKITEHYFPNFIRDQQQVGEVTAEFVLNPDNQGYTVRTEADAAPTDPYAFDFF